MVVGGTTGIGHALALGLADAGADVVASRTAAATRSDAVAARQSSSAGGGRCGIPSTSASAASLQSAARRLRSAPSAHVDIVVAAAGDHEARRDARDAAKADWNRILDTERDRACSARIRRLPRR